MKRYRFLFLLCDKKGEKGCKKQGASEWRMKMVLSIARQSVIIKCNMQRSVLTGNYEYYYAAGLLAQLLGFEIPGEILPQQLAKLLNEQAKDAVTKDEKEAYLKKLLLDYAPSEDYDEQMKEILAWGKEEKYLWTVILPDT